MKCNYCFGELCFSLCAYGCVCTCKCVHIHNYVKYVFSLRPAVQTFESPMVFFLYSRVWIFPRMNMSQSGLKIAKRDRDSFIRNRKIFFHCSSSRTRFYRNPCPWNSHGFHAWEEKGDQSQQKWPLARAGPASGAQPFRGHRQSPQRHCCLGTWALTSHRQNHS